jgi:hypothetical protein
MKKIIFTNTFLNEEIEPPVPASLIIPEWYKQMESYVGGLKKPPLDGGTASTIKRCMPVFDSITAGYIITLPGDLYVTQVDGQPYYRWTSNTVVEFHGRAQLNTYPNHKDLNSFPKFTNPWSIKTPRGYSCLFTQPFHRPTVFTILDGIVDTDKYTAPVNFPFALNDMKWEGMILKGTPIAQVIPFKRESWKFEIGQEDSFKEQKSVTSKLRSKLFDSYKTQFWSRKEFK